MARNAKDPASSYSSSSKPHAKSGSSSKSRKRKGKDSISQVREDELNKESRKAIKKMRRKERVHQRERDGERSEERERERHRDREHRHRHRGRSRSPSPKRHRSERESTRRKHTAKSTSRYDVLNADPSAGFVDGADFIPLFAASDSEREEEMIGSKRKRAPSRSPSPPPKTRHRNHSRESKSRRRQPPGRGGAGKGYRDRDGEYTREWDRGKVYPSSDDDRYAEPSRAKNTTATPWLEAMNWDGINNVAELLHSELKAFTFWISPTRIEDELRGLTVRIISDAIKRGYHDAEVVAFGSFETKLYLPGGDIDLVLLSPSLSTLSSSRQAERVLGNLAHLVKSSGISNRITIISKARIPIIKFVTKVEMGGLKVDVSINQVGGLGVGKFVRGALEGFGASRTNASPLLSSEKPVTSVSSTSTSTHAHGPSTSQMPHTSASTELSPQTSNQTEPTAAIALRALLFLTKSFLSSRSLNEVYTGGLSSYALLCMCISFLQMQPKIRRGEINPDDNLGVLAMEFFELWGCGRYDSGRFNAREVGISLRNGGIYFSKVERGWGGAELYYGNSNYRGNGDKEERLSIEDPLNVENDISSGSYAFRKVRQTFQGAFEILTTKSYAVARILEARKDGSYVNLHSKSRSGGDGRWESDRRDPLEGTSMLDGIVRIPQETLNHRKLLKQVWEEGTLHRMAGVPLPKPGEFPNSSSWSDNVLGGSTGSFGSSHTAPSRTTLSNGTSIRVDGAEVANGYNQDHSHDYKPNLNGNGKGKERAHPFEDTHREVIDLEGSPRHDNSDDEDEGGKYDIPSSKRTGGAVEDGKEPPKKRRKVERDRDRDPEEKGRAGMFTTSDEDSSDSGLDSDSESTSESGSYSRSASSRSRSRSRSKSRSYDSEESHVNGRKEAPKPRANGSLVLNLEESASMKASGLPAHPTPGDFVPVSERGGQEGPGPGPSTSASDPMARKERRALSRSNSEKKRDYWLSKGIGPYSGDQDGDQYEEVEGKFDDL